MQNQTFKIVSVPGLSGLHVVASYDADTGLYEIEELINVGVVIGDRLLRYQLPPRSMWLSEKFLQEVDSISEREFSTENPYGEFKYEGRFEKNDIVIAHAVYEKAISITIYEMMKGRGDDVQKTLYTGNFFERKGEAIGVIESLLHGDMEAEDVIFELKGLEGK